ncbi:MAG: T9SS type A sorting domain-containing protein, partial [Bacteroidales bacterium]|nr:T9SS type A sorting domain-containing protein [Bacteroidales bacterium]
HKLSQQTTFNGWIPEIGLDNGIRNHGYIWAGTYGKGIYRTKAFAGPVSVEEIAENVQNTLSIYPNPVRETTTLNFYLNENSDVNIQVFDIQGKLVRNMNFQNLDQGNNEKIMNFADLRGGMYMIKLSTKSETQTTRFIKR